MEFWGGAFQSCRKELFERLKSKVIECNTLESQK